MAGLLVRRMRRHGVPADDRGLVLRVLPEPRLTRGP